MNEKSFYGAHTALVTPMNSSHICLESLEELVQKQLDEGINGLVVMGTTGESPTITEKEQLDVVKSVLNVVQGRIPITMGATSNATPHAVHLAKNAQKAGANAILTAAPYYNKPSQEGLFRHFSAIAEAVKIPIILYSIPSRCGVEIGVSTTKRLREKYSHVIAIKESGGSSHRVSQLVEALDDDFIVLSGDDTLTLPFMALGAKGIISVASNWIAKDIVQMVSKAATNDFKEATQIHHQYSTFFEKIFIEPNPVPIKYILYKAGLIKAPEVRLPLCPMSQENRVVIDDLLLKLKAK